jgi:hypothetical protein
MSLVWPTVFVDTGNGEPCELPTGLEDWRLLNWHLLVTSYKSKARRGQEGPEEGGGRFITTVSLTLILLML